MYVFDDMSSLHFKIKTTIILKYVHDMNISPYICIYLTLIKFNKLVWKKNQPKRYSSFLRRLN